MELRLLRYFLAVAREHSITNAAKTLHITQPTLSKQLMELEDELGKKLLIRGNRKITLTDDGIYLKKRAQEIIDLVDKTTATFNNNNELVDGTIFIGAGETQAMKFIAKVIHNLQIKYPNIHYNIFSGNIDSVMEKLNNGLLDFGIFINPSQIENFETLRLPYSDTLSILVPKNSPLANLEYIEPKDLLDIPLIIPTKTSHNENFLKWLGYSLDKLNIVAVYNLIYNASLLVEQDVGCAICINNLINPTEHTNLCIKPLKNCPNLFSVIVWKKYQVFSKASKIFLEELKTELNNIN